MRFQSVYTLLQYEARMRHAQKLGRRGMLSNRTAGFFGLLDCFASNGAEDLPCSFLQIWTAGGG